MLCENELVISCRKTVCYNFVFDAQARTQSPYLRILDWIQRWQVFISFCLYNWCFVESVVFLFLSTDFNLIRKKIKGFHWVCSIDSTFWEYGKRFHWTPFGLNGTTNESNINKLYRWSVATNNKIVFCIVDVCDGDAQVLEHGN